jgi:hypothetical protein
MPIGREAKPASDACRCAGACWLLDFGPLADIVGDLVSKRSCLYEY